jgi:hypothetical protein
VSTNPFAQRSAITAVPMGGITLGLAADQQGGKGADCALDVTTGDVSKDSEAKDDVGRDGSSVSIGHASIRLNNLDVN